MLPLTLTPLPLPLPLPNPRRFFSNRQFTVRCATNRHPSAAHAADPAAVAAAIDNSAVAGASKSRSDWQSSRAMITSTAANEKKKKKTESLEKKNIAMADGKERRTLRVVYQGVPGAYSEIASRKAYDPNCEFLPCAKFEDAFQAVERRAVDRAVLPIENSLGGSIHRNYDLLLRHRLHIVGEIQLPVHHCLVALPGVRRQDLNRVISHPQALAQCEQTLSELLDLDLNITRESFYDTAGAASFVAENELRDTAAIASERAAEINGLEVLADGVHDDSGNVTRFLMLAREPIVPSIPSSDRPFRTSIVFTCEEGTSVLFKALSVFAFRDINLTKIESRPHRLRPMRITGDDDGDGDGNAGTAKRLFEYAFYVEFEASMAEVRAQNAMADVQELTSFLRVLGSYPMDVTPWSPSGGV